MNRIIGLLRTQAARVSAIRVGGVLLGLAVTSLAAHILEPTGFGAYTFVVAVVTMAAIPISFGLRQTITREAAYAIERGDDGQIGTLLGWSLKVAAIAVVVMAAAIGAWALLAADGELRGELLVGAVALLLMPAPQVLAGLLQGRGLVTRSQLPEFIVRPLVIALLFLAYRTFALEYSVQAMLFLFAVGVLAEGLTGAALSRQRNAGRNAPAPSAINGNALLYASLSFSAIAGISVVNNNLDIIMLRALAGETEVGLYRSAAALSTLASFALLVANTVTMPGIAALHQRGDHSGLQTLVTKAARFVTLAALAGGAVLLIFGKPLLALLFGPEFVVAYSALAILTAGQLANAFFGQVATILNMTGHERMTLTGVGIAVFANAALNIILVPSYGIDGAAIATASSLFLWNLLLAIGLRRRTGLRSTAL